MATYFLSPIGNSGIPFFNTQGTILSGGKLNTYLAGSTTPQATYQDPNGITPNANPVVTNGFGLPVAQIWLVGGISYKFVITDSLNNVLSTLDNIKGMNDTSTGAVSEWVVTGITPTYVSATQFTTAGNTTNTYQVGRRFRATVTAGTVYGTIVSSVFSSVTTINVLVDSGSLDSGLSAVDVGLFAPTNPSKPVYNTSQILVEAYRASTTQTSGSTIIYNTTRKNVGGCYNTSTGVFTALSPGTFLFVAQASIGNTSGGNISARISLVLAAGPTTFASSSTDVVANGFQDSVGCSGILDMALNDTVSVSNLGTALSANVVVQAAQGFSNLAVIQIS